MFEGPLYDDFLEKDQESNERSCEQHHPFFKFYVCAVRGSIDPNGSAHIIPKIIRELQKVEHLASFFAGYEFSKKSDRPIFLGAWRAVQDWKITGRMPKSPVPGDCRELRSHGVSCGKRVAQKIMCRKAGRMRPRFRTHPSWVYAVPGSCVPEDLSVVIRLRALQLLRRRGWVGG